MNKKTKTNPLFYVLENLIDYYLFNDVINIIVNIPLFFILLNKKLCLFFKIKPNKIQFKNNTKLWPIFHNSLIKTTSLD